MANNLSGHNVVHETFGDGIIYFRALPNALRHYLQYNAYTDWSVKDLYKLYREHGKEVMMANFMEAERRAIRSTYGADHPSLQKESLF